MNISQEILSDIVVYNKYAKYLPKKQRRETWKELVTRNKKMHQAKFPILKEEIEDIYKLVDIETNKFVAKLEQTNKIKFILSSAAREHIAEQGYSRKYGARFLKRFFEKHIETEIATLIIKNKNTLTEITCNLRNNRLIFNTC